MRQTLADELRRERDDARETAMNAERRYNAAQTAKEEMEAQLAQSDRQRRQAESELSSIRDEHNDLVNRCTTLTTQKRQLEVETQRLAVSFICIRTI